MTLKRWCKNHISLKGGSLKFGVPRHVFDDSIITRKLKMRKGVKVYIFGKLSALAFQKYQIITVGATGKRYSDLSPESVTTHVSLLETYLLPHLLK